VETEILPGTGVREDTDVRPDLSHGDGDHERFAHYVLKDKIVESAVTGTPVVALCAATRSASPSARNARSCTS
jgi:hypothetical protein